MHLMWFRSNRQLWMIWCHWHCQSSSYGSSSVSDKANYQNHRNLPWWIWILWNTVWVTLMVPIENLHQLTPIRETCFVHSQVFPLFTSGPIKWWPRTWGTMLRLAFQIASIWNIQYEKITVQGNKCLDNNKWNICNCFHIVATGMEVKLLDTLSDDAGILQEK